MSKIFRSPALASTLVLIAVWQVLGNLGALNESLVPTPWSALQSMLQEPAEFFGAFRQSFVSSIGGLGLSILVGMGVAFLFSLSRFFREALLPWAVFFQTVPIIAIAPLLVIYFGYGSSTVMASSFIVSLFPVLANTLAGLDRFPREQEQLFDLYRSTPWQKLVKLKLPHSLPSVFAGLRVAAGLSIVGVVAGEFVAGGGLGAIIDSGRTQQRVDRVFAALILLALMGWVLIGLIHICARILNKRRPYGIH